MIDLAATIAAACDRPVCTPPASWHRLHLGRFIESPAGDAVAYHVEITPGAFVHARLGLGAVGN